ncbi:MAG: type II toxin-antitoxin system HipA family toxin [Bacteroidota bacterium]
MSVEKLMVGICFDESEIELGELVYANRKIYFKYHPAFIERGIQISPLKLPLSSEIMAGDPEIFDGLFGVFNDSLPDGWGRLLLDRALQERGIPLGSLTPMERLAYVGRKGMGALVYKPPADLEEDSPFSPDLDEIASESQKVLAGSSTEILDELFLMGGSSGGARPKIMLGYHPETDHLISGVGAFPEGYEAWLIKFPSSIDPPDIASIEYAYYLMALEAGLNMHPCKLFRTQSGSVYFGTKRFDREEGKRLHMHSASGLMHDNFRLSTMDYGHLMDAAFRLEHHVAAYEKILRLAAFNVCAHNRDDHSKNVSFLMEANGEWRLAPAYDLTFSRTAHGYHSMTIAGEGKAPKKQHLLELARIFSVKHPQRIIEEVQESISRWQSHSTNSGVGKDSMNLIQRTLNQI